MARRAADGLSGMAPAHPVPGGVAASVVAWQASGVPRRIAALIAPAFAARRARSSYGGGSGSPAADLAG
jgi:hypothetical protein